MMKKLRKPMALLITLILSLSVLSGCGEKSPDASDQTADASSTSDVTADASPEAVQESDQKDITISVFNRKVEITDQLEAMAKEYTELTGVKVDCWGSTGDDYFSTLQGKLTSDLGPTIFTVRFGTEAEQLNAYLEDLSNEPYINLIAENMALTYDGRVVGIPYCVEGYGLIYNKDLVDAATIKDYDSFEAALSQLSAEGLNPLGLSEKSYFLLGHILNVPFAMQDDPLGFIDKLNNQEASMAENEIFQEWVKYMEAIRQYCGNPMETTYDDQVADFATEQSAMIHQGNWVWGMFEDYGVDFDMSIAPLPVMGNDKISVGVPNAWAINSQASEEEKQAARDFMEWFFTSETGTSYIVDKFNFIPAMTHMEANYLDPLSQAVLEYSNSGDSLIWTYDYWPTGIVDAFLLAAGQDFLMNESMTGQAFLEKLDAAWADANK